MPAKLTRLVALRMKPMPSDSVLAQKSRMSSAMRWSGLSVPESALRLERLIV